MISSIQGNAGWPAMAHAPQAGAPEAAGEQENDGDRDDAVRAAKAPVSPGVPSYMGNRIDTLA